MGAGIGVEKASIDEAFFDYTKAVKEILLQRYPYLAQVPKDSPDGVDTPLPPPPRIKWTDLGVGHVIPLAGPAPKEEESEKPTEKQSGENNDKELESRESEMEKHGEGSGALGKRNKDVESEENPEDIGEDEQYITTWHDVALSIAAELMDKARAKVREMGYTTSAVSAIRLISEWL